MRVLPGMQSAFVDIGLERDAFLYVSVFFDEEEEFERIVMDKSKKGDAAEASRAAHERIEQARIEREHRIEASQERAEPLLDAEPDDETAIEAGATVLDEEEEAIEAPLPQAAASVADEEEAAAEDAGGKRRGRRGRRRGKGAETEATGVEADTSVRAGATALDVSDIETPFVSGQASFERVVDEDERAAENGEMLKDAMLQERLLDQIHAVEFDLEDVPTAEVGSLLSAGAGADSSFQRIDDSDIEPASQTSETAYVQETVAAHVGAFIDEIAEETVSTKAQSFERISDDEQASEVAVASPAAGKGVKRRAAKKSSSKKKAAASAEAASEASAEETGDEAPKAKRTSRKAGAATKGAAKKSVSKKSAAKKSSSKRSARKSAGDEGKTDMDVLEGEAARARRTDIVAAEAADGEHFEGGSADDEVLADAEASITGRRSRAEMATRRGGRRRRRGGQRPHDGAAGVDEDRTNGKDEEAEFVEMTEAQPAKHAVAPSAGRGASASPRERTSRRERPEPRGGGREERAPNGRGPRSSSSSGSSSGSMRHSRHQPTITDLLREGQEILVQIAKEPIAKKGARITSHIALPGRFLVYMPTVEHVGVSRKIESDNERARLRKLIQAIRAEEDVPSGGFIVRTAGIGISEQDLRDDARYLVRLWLDIRRDAEKTKAPALAHRDLDLVQRILRDQLSDDFTAIRVDSEEEYLRIVEFINRIQPRMVKRVKLYTRD
ncbi:MAG: ribonuclease E/G, partial [Pyrinomonadaceae bacterium]|nr:ribonuclease E/G [Pyrinomonadaceae bacterium]